jgi:putative ABC transport system permease protein
MTIEQLRGDLVGAVRSLSATPIPVAAAVFTLAVAIGVNLAMLGLVDRALLSPAAHVADAARLFTLGFAPPGGRAAARMTTAPYLTFAALRTEADAFAAAAFQRGSSSLLIDGDQREVSTLLVSGNYFEVLGARPMTGRGLSPEDEVPGAEPVVMLSHEFWSSAFNRDRSVLGRAIVVGGLDYVIAGVMPESFSGHSASRVDLFIPFAAALRDSPGWDRDPYRNLAAVVVRLAPGQNPAGAATQAGAIIDRDVSLVPVAGSDVAGTERRVAWWLTGLAVLVLVMGLANTAILLAVRGARTRFNLAVRAALGASRGRLVSHALCEALVLAVAATLLALTLAAWFDETVRRILFPAVLGRTGLSAVSGWTAVGAGLAAALVGGLVNVWQLPSAQPPALLAGGPATASRRTRSMAGLLLLQAAFAVLLLAGAGLFGASLYKLGAQDFGMSMDQVLVADFEPGPALVADQDQLFTNALAQVRAMPGVQLATAIDAIPFAGFNVPPIAVPGRAEPPAVGQQLPFLNAATPEFLQILGVQVVEGRSLTEADSRGAPVVLVNQAMARGVWPGESAVGKCIRIGFDPDFDPSAFDPSGGPPMPTAVPCREVVGVVRDLRQRSVLPVENEARLMQYFVPLSQVPRPPFAPQVTPVRGLLIKAAGNAEALVPAVRRAVVGNRADLPFVRVRPYAQLLDRQMRPWSMGTRLLALFSALALVVASVGLYAAFAHAVAERRREMAIRLAVGARPAELLRMVLGDAIGLAAIGAAAGCVLAVLAGRWLQSLLYDTQVSDPLVLGAASMIMIVVAALAVFVPARTAASADPSVLLRVE